MDDEQALARLQQRDRELADHRPPEHRTVGDRGGPPDRLHEVIALPPNLAAPLREVTAPEERRRRHEEALRADAEKRRNAHVAAVLAVLPPKPRAAFCGEQLSIGGTLLQRTPAMEAALGWESGTVRLLVLRGGVGVGKSFAAAGAMHACVLRGRESVSWHRPNDFVSAVLHGYDPGAPKLGKDLVVVDDMGRETKTDFTEALITFLDDHEARLLITTNLTRDEMRERYDVRLLERLSDEGTAMGIKGDSMRKKGSGF